MCHKASVSAPQLLSQCFRAGEPQPPKPVCPKAHALQQEKPPREAYTLHQQSGPCSPRPERSPRSNKDQGRPKAKGRKEPFLEGEPHLHTGSAFPYLLTHL